MQTFHSRRVDLPLLLLLPLLLVTGCQQKGGMTDAHEQLDAVLWVQGSAEYKANTMQAYLLAGVQLDAALADRNWTAALEQEGNYQDLPPAVILDVDETCLDNSPHQGRIILADTVFTYASWDLWVNEARAQALPGAVEFCQYAASQGVTVFYVTNRRDHLGEATRKNLSQTGFPFESGFETLFTRGDNSDKTVRRAAIARNYRILLLVGDNSTDFSSSFVVPSRTVHDNMVKRFADYWGTRWIIIPNPMYGSWEASLPDFSYSLSRYGRVLAKRNALKH